MNKKYPFKFLDAYSHSDSDIFFGRDEEVDSLYQMTFQSDIILVYGASGTGKTSLIKCGLANKHRSHEWLPLHIRRGKNLNDSLLHILIEASGKQAAHEEGELDWLDSVIEKNTETTESRSQSSIEKRFKSIYLRYFRPIYLIFDQFEELFLIGSPEEQEKFIATVKDILNIEYPVKMIFAIREEYLGHLYEFEKKVPQLMRKKLRVEPMNLDKVRQVILGISQYEKSNVYISKGDEDKIAEAIFDKIKGEEHTLTIQLPYLQVFLDKLYLQITSDKKREKEATITLQDLHDIGDIEDVMQDFLEEQSRVIRRTLSTKHGFVRLDVVWKVLSPFATLEGTKQPSSKEDLYDALADLSPQLIDDTILLFVESRILRYSEEEDLYEIAHDSLARQIARKRSDEEIALLEIRRLVKNQVALKEDAREFFTEKQLNFIEPSLTKLNLSDEEKKLITESREKIEFQKEEKEREIQNNLKRARKRVQVAVVLVAIAFIAMVVAVTQWQNSVRDQINLSLIDYVNDLIEVDVIADWTDKHESLKSLKNQIVATDKINNNQKVLTFLKDSSVLAMYPGNNNPGYNQLSFQALLSLGELFIDKDERSRLREFSIVSDCQDLLDTINQSYQSLCDDLDYQIPYLYYTLDEFRQALCSPTIATSCDQRREESIITTLASNPQVRDQYARGNSRGEVLVASNIGAPVTIKNLEDAISAMAFSLDGANLYTGTNSGSLHKLTGMRFELSTVNEEPTQVYDLDEPIIFIKPLESVNKIIIASHKKILLLSTDNIPYRRIGLWDVEDRWNMKVINTLESTENGKILAVGGLDKSILLKLEESNQLSNLGTLVHPGLNVTALDIDIRSHLGIAGSNVEISLAVGNENGGLWIDKLDNFLNDSVLNEFNHNYKHVHRSEITDMEFNSGFAQMASSSLDGTIWLWNLKNPEKYHASYDHIRLIDGGQGVRTITYINVDNLVSVESNNYRTWKTNNSALANELQNLINRTNVKAR